MPTVRIIAPGAYLDAYRAAPCPPGTPTDLDDLLREAVITGHGLGRKAELNVPVELLSVLDVMALGHFRQWSDAYIQHRLSMDVDAAADLQLQARAAYQVHDRAHYARKS